MTYEKWLDKYFDDLVEYWYSEGCASSFSAFCNEKFRIYNDNNND